MSGRKSKFRADESCPHCGIGYADFKTGLKYRDVFELLKIDDDPDSETWSYKCKSRVLFHWCTIKQDMWSYHTELGGCPRDPRNQVEPDIDNVPF